MAFGETTRNDSNSFTISDKKILELLIVILSKVYGMSTQKKNLLSTIADFYPITWVLLIVY